MAEEKKFNEIIRIQKRTHNFVIIDKTFLDDARLSYKAKGIMAYLLSKPDNWKVIIRDLINHSRDGRDSVYAGLKELKECGYYYKEPVRNEKGVVTHWESVIYELPEENPSNKPSHPLPDFPDTVKADSEKAERNNNYINNNKDTNQSVSQSVIKEKIKNIKTDGQTDDKKQNNSTIDTQKKSFAPTPTVLANENTIIKTKEKSFEIDYNAVSEDFQEQINYEYIVIDEPQNKDILDEIVLIAVDCIMTRNEYVKIGSEEKPRSLVKGVLAKLGMEEIKHVIYQFKNQNHAIKNIKGYILSCMYNARMEVNSHVQNLFNQHRE